MADPTWLISEGEGDVVVRIYVDEATAGLFMKGFCDCDEDILNRDPDPSNPLLAVAPTATRVNDASSPLISGLGKDDFYDIELRASAFFANEIATISHAVMQNGKIVPAIVDNKIANRKPNGSYRALLLGKAKHAASGEDILATKFTIDAI